MDTMQNIERALAELDQAVGSEKDQAMALHAEQARYQQDPEESAVHSA